MRRVGNAMYCKMFLRLADAPSTKDVDVCPNGTCRCSNPCAGCFAVSLQLAPRSGAHVIHIYVIRYRHTWLHLATEQVHRGAADGHEALAAAGAGHIARLGQLTPMHAGKALGTCATAAQYVINCCKNQGSVVQSQNG